MFVTRRGERYEVPGQQVAVGEQAPAFALKNLADETVALTDLLGKPVILSIVPNIDTRVCAIQTKRFNIEASKLTDVHFATISNNTREEQANWCGQEGVDMLMLHDPKNQFGETYHIYIPAMERYARALYVLDATGKVAYAEVVSELTEEPNYEAALTKARELAAR